jgi:multidrug transporter EmrE-like cation transporter
MDPNPYFVLLTAIAMGVAGQLLLKLGMLRQPGFRFSEILTLVSNWLVVAGFSCYGISTLLYFQVLAKLDLSVAYPTVSLGYVLIIIMSKVLFKETITWQRWMAVTIICLGVVFVGLGSK